MNRVVTGLPLSPITLRWMAVTTANMRPDRNTAHAAVCVASNTNSHMSSRHNYNRHEMVSPSSPSSSSLSSSFTRCSICMRNTASVVRYSHHDVVKRKKNKSSLVSCTLPPEAFVFGSMLLSSSTATATTTTTTTNRQKTRGCTQNRKQRSVCTSTSRLDSATIEEDVNEENPGSNSREDTNEKTDPCNTIEASSIYAINPLMAFPQHEKTEEQVAAIVHMIENRLNIHLDNTSIFDVSQQDLSELRLVNGDGDFESTHVDHNPLSIFSRISDVSGVENISHYRQPEMCDKSSSSTRLENLFVNTRTTTALPTSTSPLVQSGGMGSTGNASVEERPSNIDNDSNGDNPIVIIISGPSGVGKDAVVKNLQQERQDLKFVVTATTRNKRQGEVDGVDYFFVTKPAFEKMLKEDELLEHAIVYGDYKVIGGCQSPLPSLLQTDDIHRKLLLSLYI